MKPLVTTTEREVLKVVERKEEWTAAKIRDMFGDDPGCLVMQLLGKVQELEKELREQIHPSFRCRACNLSVPAGGNRIMVQETINSFDYAKGQPLIAPGRLSYYCPPCGRKVK